MPHLDPARLALIAVGDIRCDEVESVHLGGCSACRDELAGMREVAAHAARSPRLRDLPPPPERVWRRIMSELGRGESAAAAAAPARSGRPARGGARSRPARRWRERARLVAVAVAAATVAAGGTLAGTQVLGSSPSDAPVTSQAPVTARAALTPSGAEPAAPHGEARVIAGRSLHLHVAGLAGHAGYYEVWLIDPDTMRMVSVGVLGDEPQAVLPLPPTVDLDTFRMVDVSAEEYGGDPGHSGNTMVSGTLRASAG